MIMKTIMFYRQCCGVGAARSLIFLGELDSNSDVQLVIRQCHKYEIFFHFPIHLVNCLKMKKNNDILYVNFGSKHFCPHYS
jgi:hypothetical protein